MLTVIPNFNQKSQQNFGQIYGAKYAIKVLKEGARILEDEGNKTTAMELKIRAEKLEEILPDAQKESDGVDMWMELEDNGLDIRVGKEIKEGHPLYDDHFIRQSHTDNAKEQYMQQRFFTLSRGTVDPRRGFGPIYWVMATPEKFGEEVLLTVKEYKDKFLKWDAARINK